MKKIIITALLLAGLLCVGGCAQETAEIPTEATTQQTIAQGYDVIGGTWEVTGLYYNGKLVELSQSEALMDLYDTVYFTASEDGSFLLYNMFFYEGSYEQREDGNFLLLVDRCFRLTMEDGEVVEAESESGSGRSYLLTVVSEGKLRMARMDPMTGQEQTDDLPMLLTRRA